MMHRAYRCCRALLLWSCGSYHHRVVVVVVVRIRRRHQSIINRLDRSTKWIRVVVARSILFDTHNTRICRVNERDAMCTMVYTPNQSRVARSTVMTDLREPITL